MKWLLPLFLALSASGCMATFDHKMEAKYRAYLEFRAKHLEHYDQQALRHDWFIDWWWTHYLVDRANRGIGEEPAHGIWATFCGRNMLREIEEVKK